MSVIPYIEVAPQQTPHKALVIWLHGLGDSGNGFAPIVPQLQLPAELAIKFIFPHAPRRKITINNGMPMRAWYDIKSLDFNSRADAAGVAESAQSIAALIAQEITQGTAANRIVLAGFSQGGVIALHLAGHFSQPLAGIIALSTYLSEPASLPSHAANGNTPIFMAHGRDDDVVPMPMGKAAYHVLQKKGYQVNWQDYDMQHNVCQQELAHIRQFLLKVLS